MRRLRTRTKVTLAFLALAVVLSGLLLAYRHFFAGSSKQIGYGITVAGSNLPGNLHAILSQARAPYSPRLATIVSPTYQIGPSGTLSSPITIQLPLTHAVPSGSRLMVMTAEAPNGPWNPLVATLSPDGKSVSVSVAHLSFFEVLRLDLSGMLSDFKEKFLDAFIPDSFKSAKPPVCQNESQARQDNYGISSITSHNVLYWCFGLENGKRVLKVVSNRVYPISIQHPSLTVMSVSQVAFLQNIEKFDASLRQEVLLLPGGEADFAADLPAGKQASIHTQWDAGGQMIVGFQVAMDTLGTIFFLFGYRAPVTIAKIGSILDHGACASVVHEGIATLHPNPGKFFATCFSYENLAKVFGEGWANMIAIVLTTGGIIDYLAGSAFGLAESFLMSDQYEVAISRGLPSPCPSSAGTCLGVRSGDMDGDGKPDQVGVTFQPGSGQFVVHVMLATGQVLTKTVMPSNQGDVFTNASFLGLTDIDGDGRYEVVVRPIGCDYSCGYVVVELLQGSLQLKPFHDWPAGDPNAAGISYDTVSGFACSVVDGRYQVLVSFAYQTPDWNVAYQADGKGGMEYVSSQEDPSNVLSGAHCPGLSSS